MDPPGCPPSATTGPPHLHLDIWLWIHHREDLCLFMNQLCPDITDLWTTLRSLRSSDMHLLHRPTQVTRHFLSLGLQTVQQPACCILLALPSSITSFKSSCSKHFFDSPALESWDELSPLVSTLETEHAVVHQLHWRCCSTASGSSQRRFVCICPSSRWQLQKNDAFILQCVMFSGRLEDWSVSKTCSEECRKQHSWVVRSKKLWRGARKGKYYHCTNWTSFFTVEFKGRLP